jgi:TatD DNase family protein
VIDTHAHLDALDDLDAVIARAHEAGVTRVLTVGTDLAGCRRALELSDAREGVFAILGIHPHEAAATGSGTVAEVGRLQSHRKAVAVGEIGLDYYRDYAPRDAQRRLFDAQLAMAADIGRPVVVHSRSADDDTCAALAAFPGTVVLHCFSSTRLLPPALEHGWYVSFAGNATFPRAADLRLAATQVPADRILAETDSPYLAPQPVRGRPNEPAYVMHTLGTLAEARGEDPAELEDRIERNATECFGLPAGANQ